MSSKFIDCLADAVKKLSLLYAGTPMTEISDLKVIHDDGQHVEGLEKADVVLVGVSRASKTPTLIWPIAATPEGHAAKRNMVAGSGFDPEDLISIAWTLGHEAGRLGLSKSMPELQPPAVPQRMAAAG
jgi:hypothetical protein